jgi:hypothetical protein
MKKRRRSRRHGKRLALPQIQFWSDAAVIVGDDLHSVAQACQDFQTAALLAGRKLVRGVISYGHHAEHRRGRDIYVVSNPLVRAAKGEASLVKNARVIIDPTNQPLIKFVKTRRCDLFSVDPDDGYLVVEPFILAMPNALDEYEKTLISLVADYKHSKHAAKYEWMLRRIVDKQIAAADAKGQANVDFFYQRTVSGTWRGTARNYAGKEIDELRCFETDRPTARRAMLDQIREIVGPHVMITYSETTMKGVYKYKPPKGPPG